MGSGSFVAIASVPTVEPAVLAGNLTIDERSKRSSFLHQSVSGGPAFLWAARSTSEALSLVQA